MHCEKHKNVKAFTSETVQDSQEKSSPLWIPYALWFAMKISYLSKNMDNNFWKVCDKIFIFKWNKILEFHLTILSMVFMKMGGENC